MPRYVTLLNWTDQGAARRRVTVEQAKAFEAVVERLGGTVREHLYTLGQYDIVIVTEFPDDETHAVALMELTSLGDVRTMSMRAFTDQETAALVAASGELTGRTLAPPRDVDPRTGSLITVWPPDA